MRRQNWWCLITAACMLFVLVTVALGARIYRWEAIVWLSLAISGNVCGYVYSRMWARD